MSLGSGDFGVLGNLAKALGIFGADGAPNLGWFQAPEASLKNMLGNPQQRAALIAFVDEALGGADRSTDAGVIWLPVVDLTSPALSVAVTIDERPNDGLHIGLGLRCRTSGPDSSTTIALPLFRVKKQSGPNVSQPLLLGAVGGRIRIASSVTLAGSPPVPGQARLGGVGLDVDLPTSPADSKGPIFGLALTGLQLPGAASPRDVRIAADGADALDDAVLDLVLSLVKAQADAALASTPIAALGGLLGLRSGDAIPDFPITQLPARGALAIADWLRDLLQTAASRNAWLDYLATLLTGSRVSDAVQFNLGAAQLRLGLRIDTGPSGNALLTPTIAVTRGASSPQLEARADVCRIDLVTGAAFALPSLGLWAAVGSNASPLINKAGTPNVRADVLRVGFALDAARKPTFVLAADGVTLGAHSYPTLDLSSPDAVMDAAGNTVSDVANQLLASLGSAQALVQQLIGITPPAGVTGISLPTLLADPLAAVRSYWQQLIASSSGMTTVLGALRNAVADASAAAGPIPGSGSAADPWRIALIGPLRLEASVAGSQLSLGLAAATAFDQIGQRCTVVETRLAASLARINFATPSAELLGTVEATLTARERGVSPPRARLQLSSEVALSADHVGLRLGWSPAGGLKAEVTAPAMRLQTGELNLPISLPVIAADGSVTLPAPAWDGVQALVGYLGCLVGGALGKMVEALGWSPELGASGGRGLGAQLRLAELVASPATALAEFLPRLALSELGPRALSLLADVFAGNGGDEGVLIGSGHPDDPYRFNLLEALPNIAIWFPPKGLEPRLFAAPEALRAWRPGEPGLSELALQAAVQAEASVAPDVRALAEDREIAAGLTALALRWSNGDGLIRPPETIPASITVRRIGLAAPQLLEQLDFIDLIDREPTTTVYVAIGATAFADKDAARRVDLSSAGLAANMFTPPAAATGDWFVALGRRVDCRAPASSSDGTAEQAERLGVLLSALSAVSSNIALVAVGGAGHAARLAAQAAPAVTDLVLLGTPLAEISLEALSVQPTADALRLLARLLPEPSDEPDDEDLALGRGLVRAMLDLTSLPQPAAELALPPGTPLPTPRAGLTVTALFGDVSATQVSQAITAIVAAGLAQRANARDGLLPKPTGVHAGLRWVLPPTTPGAVKISASALLQVFAYDLSSGIDLSRVLRVQLRIADPLGWLVATHELELRALSADIIIPLDGSGPGTARLVLHEARVFGQSWEALVLGNTPDALPLLPEARVLLASGLQRLVSASSAVGDAAAIVRALATRNLLTGLGLLAANGSVVNDAVDQLLHDPAGLLQQRLLAQEPALASALNSLLGALGASVDLPARTVRLIGGNASSGRFGWQANLQASPTALGGTLRIGADLSNASARGFAVETTLNPFSVQLHWRQAGGADELAPLWPAPNAAALARMLARAAPSLAGNVALELMRRADASAQSLIDALLDALGLLSGSAGDAQRALRPLVGLLGDPAGWLRSNGSLAANPAKIQALLDALRPLMGLTGGNGSALALANGVSLSVASQGAGARLALNVDPSGWAAPAGAGPRLSGGIGVALDVGLAGAPTLGLQTHLGLATPAQSGRQAVHVQLGAGGVSLFIRPASGNDISLLPFAGLGSLAAAAEAALPFLLDQLAGISSNNIGSLVATLGDALNLRTTVAPIQFDSAKLHSWGVNPAGAFNAALPTIGASVITALAPQLSGLLPAGVSASNVGGALQISMAGVSLVWQPAQQKVSVSAASLAVPGIQTLGFAVTLGSGGLDLLSIALGPAQISAGSASLRPFARISAGGNVPGGRNVLVGISSSNTQHFALRCNLDAAPAARFAIVAGNGALAVATLTDAAQAVALRAVEVLADLVVAVALAQPPLTSLLNQQVVPGGITVRNLLRGVVLADVPNPNAVVVNLFDPTKVLEKVGKLFTNIAGAAISFSAPGGLTLAFANIGGAIGLQVGVASRFPLLDGDVSLWLENDDSWIDPNPPGSGGLFVGLITPALVFKPSLVVNGLGLRIGRASGPLLDAGITLESIALHVYAAINSSAASSGGVQLQFSNLAVGAGGSGGSNGIAQGMMRDTGPTPPKPAFSPALAIQKHGNAPVSVTLRAGDGAGPWWIAIQKGFGPLYLEQIGFGATMPQGRLERISLLMDGSVSLFGLTCAVDDLQITYLVANNDFFNPSSWAVDLAGLAVSANMAGVSLAGGLLKQNTPAGTEYLGMLLGRFAVYGLTVYGGYGEGTQNGQKFTSFFAIGAVNGPIGGPPAFFLTGIGGGFGINRKLVIPTELANFGDYPLIQALDIAATPQDPMTQLRALGQYFPMNKGTFWFAAGLSFNSFALVDGIAVVGVQVGDGLDINLLGLARMALPRPQVALVSIEIALKVRFSTSEGVLWVQGQLTDNSWLLYEDVKLTGGFAYVIWFKGEHKGEFVLTLGGYHPDFHRDGYPVVPRLGLRWSIGSSIVIKAGCYFALTSEALMAGGDFEASATLGPAWAEVKFGAHGIIYFDPFAYDVLAYAKIAAGVTIDTWIFGEITISISIGARLHVLGPDFRGTATFEIGPIECTFDFGGSEKAQKQPISAGAFIQKYLEADDGGAARPHALMTNTGTLPAKGDQATPDGSSTRPFVVVAEFSMSFTSTVPATKLRRVKGNAAGNGPADSTHAPSRSLGVAPMNADHITPQISLSWLFNDAALKFPFAVTPRSFGRFPVGVWGLPQDPNNRKLPKGQMIEALNELDLSCTAKVSPPGPEIPYYQVEIGKRRPLPFTRSSADIAQLRNRATAITALITQPLNTEAAFSAALPFLAQTSSPTALAALRGERQAPPRLGSLTEGLEALTETIKPGIATRPSVAIYDHRLLAPVTVALLPGASLGLRSSARATTTVANSARAWRQGPPTLARVEALRSRSIAARLVVMPTPASTRKGRTGQTLIASLNVPPTSVAHNATAMVARTGGLHAAALGSFSQALDASAARATTPGALLASGGIAVLRLPNAGNDAVPDVSRPRLLVEEANARIVLLSHGGRCLADAVLGPDGNRRVLEIPMGTERVVAIGLGRSNPLQPSAASGQALVGWHAGMQLPYAGWSSAIAPGAVLHATGERINLHRERAEAGWIAATELVRGVATVSTQFSAPPRTVVIALDDPAALGDVALQRQLLMGLAGAERAVDVLNMPLPPVLLTMDNRSILAYEIVPGGDAPVTVTVASEEGWSLVGVMGSATLSARAAVALIAARGFDAAMQALVATRSDNGVTQSRLIWQSPDNRESPRQLARSSTRKVTAKPATKAKATRPVAKPKAVSKPKPKAKTQAKPTSAAAKAPRRKPPTKKTGGPR